MSFDIAERHDPIRGFKYVVELETPVGTARMGCSRVSGLRAETEVVEYREGHELSTTRKLPGLTSYDNVVLEHGQIMLAAGQDIFNDWYKLIKTIDGDGVSDFSPENIRGTVTITIFSKATNPVSGAAEGYYRIENAWPTIYEHADLEAGSSEVWFERVELAHEGIEYFHSS